MNVYRLHFKFKLISFLYGTFSVSMNFFLFHTFFIHFLLLDNFFYWEQCILYFQVFTDGATNKLIGCYHIPPSSTTEPQNPSGNGINVVCLESVPDEEVVLVRIYGHNTELLIDRKQEICDFKLLHSYGFASRLLAIFKNGLAYEYAHGSVTTKESIYDDRVWHKVAKRMAEMHRIVQRKGNPDKQPVLWKKLDNFFKLIPNRYTDPKKQEM